MNHKVRIDYSPPMNGSTPMYLLKFKYWFGDSHLHFRSVKEIEQFADEIKEAVGKMRE